MAICFDNASGIHGYEIIIDNESFFMEIDDEDYEAEMMNIYSRTNTSREFIGLLMQLTMQEI